MLMSPMRDGRTTSEDSATQLLICEPLSFAIPNSTNLVIGGAATWLCLGSNQSFPVSYPGSLYQQQSGRHAIRGLPALLLLLMQPALIFRQSPKLPPCSRTRQQSSAGPGRSSWISPASAPSGYLACAAGFDCCSRPGAFPQRVRWPSECESPN